MLLPAFVVCPMTARNKRKIVIHTLPGGLHREARGGHPLISMHDPKPAQSSSFVRPGLIFIHGFLLKIPWRTLTISASQRCPPPCTLPTEGCASGLARHMRWHTGSITTADLGASLPCPRPTQCRTRLQASGALCHLILDHPSVCCPWGRHLSAGDTVVTRWSPAAVGPGPGRERLCSLPRGPRTRESRPSASQRTGALVNGSMHPSEQPPSHQGGMH